MKANFVGIFVGLSFWMSFVGAETLSCEKVFLSQDLSRGLKADYLYRNFGPANQNRVVEITDQAPVLNQGNRGTCHMHALYGDLVHEYKARNNGQDPNISIEYWTYFHWLNRAVATAQDPKAGLEIPEGSWYENSFDIIKKFGVLSKDQYARVGGKTDIATPEKNLIELGQLKTIVERAHLEKSLFLSLLYPQILPKKTRGSYFTLLLDNPVARQQLINLIERKEKAARQGETHLTLQQIQILKDISKGRLRDQQLSDLDKSSFIANLNADIQKTVESEFNSIYFGQSKNPLGSDHSDQVKRAHEMFPELMQKTVSFVTDGTAKAPLQFLERKEDHLFFKNSLASLPALIKSQIDRNNSVWIGYDHNSYYADNKTGALTIEGFYSTPFHPHVSRSERNLTDLYYGGHAVQIVGYELNEKNEIVAFKIQNSWGEERGAKGYYRMDMSYFNAYIWRITLRDEMNQFTEPVIESLQAAARAAKIKGRLPK